jgi:hypothetical protein
VAVLPVRFSNWPPFTLVDSLYLRCRRTAVRFLRPDFLCQEGTPVG